MARSKGESPKEPPSSAVLQARYHGLVKEIEDERLPGWEAFVAKNKDAQKWIDDQHEKAELAIRNNDEFLLERVVGNLMRAWGRVNESLAEDYRQENAEPELWQLRYFKWMTKVRYMKMGSPLGEFYIVPRAPSSPPKTDYWYTADEMIEMLKPSVAATINAFGVLPSKNISKEKPPAGEKQVVLDFSGGTPDIHYVFKGGPKRG